MDTDERVPRELDYIWRSLDLATRRADLAPTAWADVEASRLDRTLRPADADVLRTHLRQADGEIERLKRRIVNHEQEAPQTVMGELVRLSPDEEHRVRHRLVARQRFVEVMAPFVEAFDQAQECEKQERLAHARALQPSNRKPKADPIASTAPPWQRDDREPGSVEREYGEKMAEGRG